MTQLTAMVKVRKAFEQVAVLDLMGELTSSAEAALLNAYEEASNDDALVSNIGTTLSCEPCCLAQSQRCAGSQDNSAQRAGGSSIRWKRIPAAFAKPA